MLGGTKNWMQNSAAALVAALLAETAFAAPPPGTQITNEATVVYTRMSGGDSVTQTSQVVIATVQAPPPPTVGFFNGTFTHETYATLIGTTLNVQATATRCNTNFLAADSVLITLSSQLTTDTETFVAIETAPNSGVFRIVPSVPTRDASVNPVIAGNGILETLPNDSITATLAGCGAASTQATILVDPFGVVFDSRNNLPVAGVTVRLIDVTGAGNGGHPNQPAKVFAADGVTPAPATVVTGLDGKFTFLLVLPSTYRLQLAPPAGVIYPSQVPIGGLPAGRQIDPTGSYGGNFIVSAAFGAVQVDVPVDRPVAAAGLFVEKTVSPTEAEVGDTVSYTIQIRNTTTNNLANAVVSDSLPAGFEYLAKTTQLDGTRTNDPTGGPGPALQFNVGTLPNGSTRTLTYRVRVGTGALQGTGKNRAQATAVGPSVYTSNIAIARVHLKAGVFTDKAIVIGKVFVDKNHNRIQDDGEPGIAGVRLYFEDGTYSITDSEGKYSIYGLSPRTHVLKVDETTLPRGCNFSQLTPRHNTRGTLCLVDLKRNELRKVDFADVSDNADLLQDVIRRRAKGDPDLPEISQSYSSDLGGRFTANGSVPPPADVRAQPAAGVVASSGTTTNQPVATVFKSVRPEQTLNDRNSNLPERPVLTVPRTDLAHSLSGVATNTLGFVGAVDGETLPVAQANIRVKGPLGSTFKLTVNDTAVPERTVGTRARLADRQIEAWEFVGVNLVRGTNTLVVTAVDGFGNERGRERIEVVAPGGLGRLDVEVPKNNHPADGTTPVVVTVVLRDDQGVPVSARTPVTLESSLGRWDLADANPAEPGVQTFVTGGLGMFKLLPPAEPGQATIAVSSGVLKREEQVAFVPELRPMLVAGVVETRMSFRRFNLSALQPARQGDAFEEELRNWAFQTDNGKLAGGARAALFLKGKVKGDYLLTLAYDSDKESKARLFRDIQPDEFYPVYGDAAVRGFDAQTTGKLYVRIDKRNCYLLYGDFNTQSGGESRGLGNYSRSFTGLKEHYENSRVSANAWGAYDSLTQVIREIPADGTSGPFGFRVPGALENSEKVELIVRDRNQTGVILQVIPQQRFADYEFEPFSGRLLFKAPVPSLDENLNPISIRVTFEVNQGGQRFLVTGADAQVKVTPHWEVGGATIWDLNPQHEYQLHSVNTTYKVAANTFILGEVAQSHSDVNGTGRGGRIELRHTDSMTDLRVFASHVESNFDNTASIVAANRQEMGAKISRRLSPTDRVTAEVLDTRDITTGGELRGATISHEHTFPNQLRLELGLRHSDQTATPSSAQTVGGSPTHVNSVRARVTSPVPYLPLASVYGEIENDLNTTDRRAVTVGADYQVANRARLYARHEFMDAVGSPFDLNSNQQNNRTVFGLETEYLKDAHLFNEYRMRDSVTGRESETAIGLRNGWRVADGLRLTTSFERVNPITGSNQTVETTALSLGFDYTANPLSKTSGRIEFRRSDATDHWLSTLGHATKLNDTWTALARGILNYDHNRGAGQSDLFQSRMQLGMAYRPTRTDVWNGLLKYEYKYEDDQSLASAQRHVHILTMQINDQPLTNLTLSARYAPKIVLEGDDSYVAHLLAGRVMYDLAPRWSVGLNGSAFFNGAFRGLQYGLGPEIGFRLHDNVWVDAGYNFLGFYDRDLSDGNYTDHGFFVGVRLTFDEHIGDTLKRRPKL